MSEETMNEEFVNDSDMTATSADADVTERKFLPRTLDQRRRWLIAVVAGVPMIVAGSAQTAYASGSTEPSSGNTP